MKTMITILLAALAAMFYVGCSNGTGSIVGVPSDNGKVSTEISIPLEAFGSALAKTTALEDTLRVSLLSGSTDGPLISRNLIPLNPLNVDWDDTIKVVYHLDPEETYRVLAGHGNERFGFRDGKVVFTVPNVDTFKVFLECKALITPFSGSVVLKNSVLSDKAIGMNLTCSLVPTGSTAPSSFSIKREFEAGTKDTLMFAETLFVNYAWDIDLSFPCNDENIAASGSLRTPILVGGEDYNFSIIVTVSDNKKVVAKVAIIPQPYGRATFSVVFEDET